MFHNFLGGPKSFLYMSHKANVNSEKVKTNSSLIWNHLNLSVGSSKFKPRYNHVIRYKEIEWSHWLKYHVIQTGQAPPVVRVRPPVFCIIFRWPPAPLPSTHFYRLPSDNSRSSSSSKQTAGLHTYFGQARSLHKAPRAFLASTRPRFLRTFFIFRTVGTE